MENIVHPTSPIALKHLQIKIKRRGIAKVFSWTVCSNNILFMLHCSKAIKPLLRSAYQKFSKFLKNFNASNVTKGTRF